jgi:hypothetical protein
MDVVVPATGSQKLLHRPCNTTFNSACAAEMVAPCSTNPGNDACVGTGTEESTLFVLRGTHLQAIATSLNMDSHWHTSSKGHSRESVQMPHRNIVFANPLEPVLSELISISAPGIIEYNKGQVTVNMEYVPM